MIKMTTDGHLNGFHMTFVNGYTVSVQTHDGAYANAADGTAEVGVWDADGECVDMADYGGNSFFVGWCDADKVATIINDFSQKD